MAFYYNEENERRKNTNSVQNTAAITKSPADEFKLRRAIEEELRIAEAERDAEGWKELEKRFVENSSVNAQGMRSYSINNYDELADRNNFVENLQAQRAQRQLEREAAKAQREAAEKQRPTWARTAMSNGESIKSAAELNYEMERAAPQRYEDYLRHKEELKALSEPVKSAAELNYEMERSAQQRYEDYLQSKAAQKAYKDWEYHQQIFKETGGTVESSAERIDRKQREQQKDEENARRERYGMDAAEYVAMKSAESQKRDTEIRVAWNNSGLAEFDNIDIAIAYANGEFDNASELIREEAERIYMLESFKADEKMKHIGGGAWQAFMSGLVGDLTFGLDKLLMMGIDNMTDGDFYKYTQLNCLNNQGAQMLGGVASMFIPLPMGIAGKAVKKVGGKVVNIFGQKAVKEIVSEAGEKVIKEGVSELGESVVKNTGADIVKKMATNSLNDAAGGYLTGATREFSESLAEGQSIKEAFSDANRSGLMNAGIDAISPIVGNAMKHTTRSGLQRLGAELGDSRVLDYFADITSDAAAGYATGASVGFLDSVLSGQDLDDALKIANQQGLVGGATSVVKKGVSDVANKTNETVLKKNRSKRLETLFDATSDERGEDERGKDERGKDERGKKMKYNLNSKDGANKFYQDTVKTYLRQGGDDKFGNYDKWLKNAVKNSQKGEKIFDTNNLPELTKVKNTHISKNLKWNRETGETTDMSYKMSKQKNNRVDQYGSKVKNSSDKKIQTELDKLLKGDAYYEELLKEKQDIIDEGQHETSGGRKTKALIDAERKITNYKNSLQGVLFQDQVSSYYDDNGVKHLQEVSARGRHEDGTLSKERTRVDNVLIGPEDKLIFIENKSSESAPYTINQVKIPDMIVNRGGRLVGNNAKQFKDVDIGAIYGYETIRPNNAHQTLEKIMNELGLKEKGTIEKLYRILYSGR